MSVFVCFRKLATVFLGLAVFSLASLYLFFETGQFQLGVAPRGETQEADTDTYEQGMGKQNNTSYLT